MMTHLSPIRPRSCRHLLMLLILYSISAVWGCAVFTDVQPAQIRCPGSIQTKVSAIKHSVTISYAEPAVTMGGGSLSDLAKTTIYYDLGDSRRQAKEVPATKPTGGGQISETISVPITTQEEPIVRICVIATDRYGNESAMVP